MNVNNYVVHLSVTGVNGHSSTGYMFNTICQSKTLILTSKHSICADRTSCQKVIEDKDNCRKCNPEFNPKNINISRTDNSLKTLKVCLSERADVAIIEVVHTDDVPPLSQTDTKSDNYVVWCALGKDRYLLNYPAHQSDGLGKYNIASNVSANLQTKKDELSGVSGGLIFKVIDDVHYATAVVTEDGGANDIGAEILNDVLVKELNELTGTINFIKRTDIISKQFKESNIIKSPAQSTEGALSKLIELSKQLSKSDPDYKYMLDELSEFLTARPGRKVIGLKNKLIEGNRENLFLDAKFLSNKFARRVSNGQFSPTDQIIFLHCLGFINTVFRQSISPSIRSGATDIEIDAKILNEIILPLNSEVSEFSMSVSTGLISGMLYFLTGKCHIRWV